MSGQMSCPIFLSRVRPASVRSAQAVASFVAAGIGVALVGCAPATPWGSDAASAITAPTSASTGRTVMRDPCRGWWHLPTECARNAPPRSLLDTLDVEHSLLRLVADQLPDGVDLCRLHGHVHGELTVLSHDHDDD